MEKVCIDKEQQSYLHDQKFKHGCNDMVAMAAASPLLLLLSLLLLLRLLLTI